MNENAINRYLHGRYFTVVIFCFTIISTLIALYSGRIPQFGSNYGICLPSSNLWINNPLLSYAVNIALISGIAVMLIITNKAFSFIRGVTSIFASIFLLLESCNPYITTQLFDGTIMCLVTVTGMFILYSIYQTPQLKQRIYLIFALLSLCCMFQYAFVFIIPVFITGIIQMRAFTFKGFVAAVLGVITPFWILTGLGVISLDKFVIPQITNVFTITGWEKATPLLVSVGATALISFVFLIIKMIHIYNSKLQVRAYNGFISILTLFTIIMICIDYNNFFTYIPLLNCCAAIQIAHFFTNNKYLRKYIIVIVLITGYLALYIWGILQ